MSTYWISAQPGDKKRLEDMGIVLGPYDKDTNEFTRCEIPDEAFEKLEECWGEFTWGPEGITPNSV